MIQTLFLYNLSIELMNVVKRRSRSCGAVLCGLDLADCRIDVDIAALNECREWDTGLISD